ncbi:MAG: efflux RND transporter periplasmic adaptor subunit [Rhodanobacter sp.]|jgi:RND family efflux transporter MFP subunit
MSDLTFPTAKPPSPRRLRLAAIIAVVLVAGVVILGVATRISDAHQLRTWTEAQAAPTVDVLQPQASATGMTLDLPGRIDAYAQAPIYARVSGYLKSWKVDIGTHVHAGQLLGEIETPDLDQQLLQARADLASAQANAALASTTAKRWQAMLASDAVSRQEVDEKVGDFAAKRALADAARANVDRIDAMKQYTRIVAPFDGVVTARHTDIGALINAGNSGGQPLFEVSDVRRLRIYVQVPQSDMPLIAAGSTATFDVPGYPGRRFSATIEASSGAVSAASGSTLVQLSADNDDGKLMPGSYASVHFHLAANRSALQIPVSALVFDQSGLRVATLVAGDRVAFRTVTIVRDYGKSVEIGSGLAADTRVIDSPPDGLVDGDRVQVSVPATVAGSHAKA